MLDSPPFRWPGTVHDLRDLVAAHPWATLVSATPSGLVVSHLPLLVDARAGEPEEDLVVVGHLARADAEHHHLGEVDAVVVVQGEHGYVSASWYATGPAVSTWNYVVAHLHGRPEVLDADGSWRVLERTMARFEDARPQPFRLARVADYAARIAPHVTSFRLAPTRVDAKAKLSQDKPAADVAGVLQALEDPTDVHARPGLAEAMRRLGGTAS